MDITNLAGSVAHDILGAIEKGSVAFNKGSSDRCLTLYSDTLHDVVKKLKKEQIKGTALEKVLEYLTAAEAWETKHANDEDEVKCREIRTSFDKSIDHIRTKVTALKFRERKVVTSNNNNEGVDPNKVSQRTSQKMLSANLDDLGLKEVRLKMETGKNAIKLKKHSAGILKSFKESFTGSDVLAWFKAEIKHIKPERANDLAQKLVEKKFILSCQDAKHNKFKEKEIYKFAPVKMSETEQKQIVEEEKIFNIRQEEAGWELDWDPSPKQVTSSTGGQESKTPIKPSEKKDETAKSPQPAKSEKKPTIYPDRLEPIAKGDEHLFSAKEANNSGRIIAFHVCKWLPFISGDTQKRKGGWILDLRLVNKDWNSAICSSSFLKAWLPPDQLEKLNKIVSAFHVITLSGTEQLCLLIKEAYRLEKATKEPAKKKVFSRGSNNNNDKPDEFEESNWIINQQNQLFAFRRFGTGAIPVPKRRGVNLSEREIFKQKNK